MLIPFIYAFGIITAFFLFNVLSDRLVRLWVYVILFLALYCAAWVIENRITAFEPENIHTVFYEDNHINLAECDISFIRGYEEKVSYHKRKAAEAFCEAEDLCLFLPEDKKQIAYSILQGVVEASAATWVGGWAALVADAVIQMTKYGIFCSQQSDKIKNHLQEAEYHYQMACYYYNK